jgi:hypothetical protein
MERLPYIRVSAFDRRGEIDDDRRQRRFIPTSKQIRQRPILTKKQFLPFLFPRLSSHNSKINHSQTVPTMKITASIALLATSASAFSTLGANKRTTTQVRFEIPQR